MNRYVTGIVVALAIALLGVVSVQIARGGKPGCGRVTGKTYTVQISGGEPSRATVQARQCDVFIVTNTDNVERLVAFGYHDHHATYNGTTEKLLKQGESLRVTLNTPGKLHWHDHYHDETQGDLTVTR